MSIRKVYLLEAHDHIDSVHEEFMTIGFFETDQYCRKVIARYKKLPGFCMDSCEFVIRVFELEEEIPEDKGCVYYVQTYADHGPENDESVLYEGVYQSEELATEMAARFQNDAESQNRIDQNRELMQQEINTIIDHYEINRCFWEEGFERYTWEAEED